MSQVYFSIMIYAFVSCLRKSCSQGPEDIHLYIFFLFFNFFFFHLYLLFKLKKSFSYLSLWSSKNDFSLWCKFLFLFFYVFNQYANIAVLLIHFPSSFKLLVHLYWSALPSLSYIMFPCIWGSILGLFIPEGLTWEPRVHWCDRDKLKIFAFLVLVSLSFCYWFSPLSFFGLFFWFFSKWLFKESFLHLWFSAFLIGCVWSVIFYIFKSCLCVLSYLENS